MSNSAAEKDNEPFVNAKVTLLIPMDGVSIDADSRTKLEAAVRAFEASPAAEIPEATTITFEDVRCPQ